MRILVIIILFLTIMLFSCSPEQENKSRKPSNLLTWEQMVSLLAETQLIEAAKSKNFISTQDSMKEVKEGYALVFNKYGISKKDFEENLDYYYDFSEKAEELFGDALNELIKMEAELNKVEEDTVR